MRRRKMRRYRRKICAIAAGVFFIGQIGMFPVCAIAGEPEREVVAQDATEQENSGQQKTTDSQGSKKRQTEEIQQREDGERKLCIGIDNRHVYEGMNQSFSNGYRPSVEKDTFTVIVPFTVSGTPQDGKITVDLQYPTGSESPFEQKNYQKDVKAGIYLFDGEEQRTYLYQLTGSLKKDAKAGQYPLIVKASAYDLQGEKTELECTVFIKIEETENNTQGGEDEDKNGAGKDNENKTDNEGDGNLPDDKDTDEAGENGDKQQGEIPGENLKENPEEDAGEDLQGGVYEGGYSGGSMDGGSGGSEEVLRQPKMLLESCSLSGKKLEAGSSQKMTVVFRNRSTSSTMYNLKVVASIEAAGIKLDKNSWYFGSVGANKEITLENELSIQQDAVQGDAVITYTFEYEDEKGNAATGTETLSLAVKQPVRMELEAEDIPVNLYATDTIELSMKALNLSRTGVYNVRIQLEGTGLFPTEEIFIGNMEAGTEGEGAMRVYVGTRTMEAIGEETGENDAEKYGEIQGTVTLLYEDAAGEAYEEKKDFQTEIRKPQIVSLTVEEEKEANSWWVSVAAAAFLGMAAVILLLVGLLRKKAVLLKEAEMVFGENDQQK